MKEAGCDVQRVSYDHPVHGYLIRVAKDEKGVYHPDDIQLQAIQQALEFFKTVMGPRRRAQNAKMNAAVTSPSHLPQPPRPKPQPPNPQ